MATTMRFESVSEESLRILGLDETATWESIVQAHRSLVSDLTPGPGANHSNVTLALSMLDDVNRAFDSLRVRMVA